MSPLRRQCLRCGADLPMGSEAMTCASCREALPQVITAAPGQTEKPKEEPLPAEIGGYRIEKLLGRGGMGSVYLAREPVLGRQVALKVLHKGLRTPEGTERMLEEAVVTATLSHPGIAPVYRVGEDPAHGLWYAMKLVDGRSLADILTSLRGDHREDQERYTLPALLGIFHRVCEAVAFAHHVGIVHRDLKPANIMVGEFGEVMVLDWGLARVVDAKGERQRPAVPAATELGVSVGSDSAFSRAGTVLGTAGFMSPEQARGQAATAGPPSDVYALGAILYTILTLRLPVDGRPDEQIQRTIRGQVVPLEKRPMGRNAPRALSQAAMKALSLDPAKRHPDARELAREIEAYLEGRVAWTARTEPWEAAAGNWKFGPGELAVEKGPASALHGARLTGDVRLTARVHGAASRPSWRLDVQVGLRAAGALDAYLFRVVAGEDGAVELYRAGVLLSRRQDAAPDAHHPHEVCVTREGDHVALLLDGRLVLEHRDVFPLRGQRLAVTTDEAGLRLSEVRIETRGTPLQLQFLALPDKLLSLGRMAEARELYREMAETHAERSEGLIARYKAAVCSIEMGEREEAQRELKSLEGTSHEALQALGRARLALRAKNFKDAWAALTEGCEKYRNDPLRVELWSNVLMAVDRVERESAANARTLYLQLLKMPWLAPHEIIHVCGALIRHAAASGGPVQARGEALALLEGHPTQLGARMEFHAFLARLGAPKDVQPAIRAALQKTLDLTDQVTRSDRARLILWLIEAYLSEGNIAGAEKWLTNAVSSLSHPSSAGLWARNWRALVAGAQGKWLEAEKFLNLHAAAYSGGESAQHFLSLLLESLAAGIGSDAARIAAGLHRRLQGHPEWAELEAALTGAGAREAFATWIAGQPREARCALLLAGSLALAARGDAAGAEALRARAIREQEGRAFAAWFAEKHRAQAQEQGKTIVRSSDAG